MRLLATGRFRDLWTPESVWAQKGVALFLSKDRERWAHFSFGKSHTHRRLGAVLASWCPGPPGPGCPHTSTVPAGGTARARSPRRRHRTARRGAGSAGLPNAQPHTSRDLQGKQCALSRESLKFQSHLCLIPLFAYLGEKKIRKKKSISWSFSVTHQVSPAQNANSPSSFPTVFYCINFWKLSRR